MVEFSPLPAYLGMTSFTIGGKAQVAMRRVAGIIVISLMAGQANIWRTDKSLRVALIAIYQGVRAP